MTKEGNELHVVHREFDPANPLSSFVDVLRRVVMHPVAYFAGIPRRGGLRNPFFFALTCIVIGSILNAMVELIGIETPQGLSLTQYLLGPLGLSISSFAGFMASIVISVVIGIIFLPVLAGIYQLLVRMVVRDKRLLLLRVSEKPLNVATRRLLDGVSKTFVYETA